MTFNGIPVHTPTPTDDLSALIVSLRHTQEDVNDLFVRLTEEKAALDRTMQHCAARDVQGKVLFTAFGEFVAGQTRVRANVQSLLSQRNESDAVMKEEVMRLFKEKQERDATIAREITEALGESEKRERELERLLGYFDNAIPPKSEGEERHEAPTTNNDVRVPCPPPRVFTDSPEPMPEETFQTIDTGAFNGPPDLTLNPFLSPPSPNSPLDLADALTPTLAQPHHMPTPPPDPTPFSAGDWDFFDNHVPLPPSSSDLRSETDFVTPSEEVPSDFATSVFEESESDEEEPPPSPVDHGVLEDVDESLVIPELPWTVAPVGIMSGRRRSRGIPTTEVVVTDGWLNDGSLTFSVLMCKQPTDPEPLAELAPDLDEYHRNTYHPLDDVPAKGDFVSVWYPCSICTWNRGQILHVTEDRVAVLLVDSGVQVTVRMRCIRALPNIFRALPRQTRQARLSFVELAKNPWDVPALDRFLDLCRGHHMQAKLDHEAGLSLHLRLTDPAAGSGDIMASVNAQLLREGLAVIDQKGCPYLSTYRYTVDLLEEVVEQAKKEHVGIYSLLQTQP